MSLAFVLSLLLPWAALAVGVYLWRMLVGPGRLLNVITIVLVVLLVLWTIHVLFPTVLR